MSNTEGNTGWADAMSKILVVKKPKKNKTIVLSKGKKLSLMKTKNSENDENITEENQLNLLNHAKQKEIFMKGRVKPNILEKDKEKRLQKITVKGVVKLFNAVNKHQQNNNNDKIDNSGPVMTKKEKMRNSVSKSSFLNYLMGDIKEEIESDENDVKMEVKEEDDVEQEHSKIQNRTWEVLQNNYGIGVKLKNWDNKPMEQIDII